MKATVTILLTVMALAAFALDDAAQKDLAMLQGEWSMISGSADGQPMPEASRLRMRRICKGDETTTLISTQVFFRAKFTLDPTKTPKAIDYQMIEGATKGQKQLGIYEINGDTFKASFGKPGSSRPTDFTSKPGDGNTVSEWKRVPATMQRKLQIAPGGVKVSP